MSRADKYIQSSRGDSSQLLPIQVLPWYICVRDVHDFRRVHLYPKGRHSHDEPTPFHPNPHAIRTGLLRQHDSICSQSLHTTAINNPNAPRNSRRVRVQGVLALVLGISFLDSRS